jgi:hypothetical protein
MGFLIPASLLALAFVAGPIVAHLVRRRGVDVRTLPTVRYLHAALAASSRKRRIVDVVLLAIRILAVVGLALAAAQPFRTLPASDLGSVAVTATFLVDDSHSMRAERDGTPLVRDAVRLALADLAALPPGSFVSVIAAGAPPRVLVRRARARDLAESALRSLEGGSARGGALVEAIDLAHGTFEPGLARHLFVYSDFAAHEAAHAPSFPRETRVHLSRLRPSETYNRRVVDARARALDAEGTSLAVDVRVRSDESARGTFELGLFRDGELLARDQGAFDESGEGRLTLEVDAATAGASLEARLLDWTDALPGDDSRHLLTHADEYTRVVVVDGKPRPQLLDSASGFFRAALKNAPLREGRFSVRTVDDEGLDERVLADADVVVYADVHAPSPARFARVMRKVERGAGLLIILGGSSDPFAYMGLLGAHAPGRILAASSGEKSGAESAVLAHDPVALRTTKHFPIEPEGDAEVLLTLAGAPIAVERAHGSGKITLVGVPLDDSLSNFPYLPSYLPTVVALVSRLSPPALAQRIVTAGDVVRLEPFFRDRDELTVETPGGERIEVERADPKLEQTGEAGVYRLLDVGTTAGSAFVAVPPLDESSLEAGPIVEPPSLDGEASARATSRADLTPWLALLAALFLATEGFIRTRTVGRQARVETTTRGIPPRSASE